VARSALDSSSTCLYIAEELLRRNSGFFWLDHWSDDVGGSCLLYSYLYQYFRFLFTQNECLGG